MKWKPFQFKEYAPLKILVFGIGIVSKHMNICLMEEVTFCGIFTQGPSISNKITCYV